MRVWNWDGLIEPWRLGLGLTVEAEGEGQAPDDGAGGGTPPTAGAPAGGADTGEANSGEPADGQGSEGEGVGAPPATVPPVTKSDWRDRRIARLTAQLKEARALASKTPLADGEARPAAGAYTEADVERLAEERASLKAAQRLFDQRCNDAAEAGKRAYGAEAFQGALTSLRQTFDPQDPASNASWLALVDAALETGEAPRLLYELGQDLDEASRIMGLTPAKMGLELGKRLGGAESGSGTRNNVTGAPKPITPLAARGRSHDPIKPSDPDRADRLTTAEWMARRNAEVAQVGQR